MTQPGEIDELIMDVSMPKPDGAPYRCGAFVMVAPPYNWDNCTNDATHAYQGQTTKRNYLRCDEHRPTIGLIV